jgi:hypothetical protein
MCEDSGKKERKKKTNLLKRSEGKNRNKRESNVLVWNKTYWT